MAKPTVKDFSKARLAFDQTAQEVADHFGYSRTYIYEVLKYPNKNPELHKKITAYCKKAEANDG